MKCCIEFYFTMKTEGKKKETGAGGVRASICPWKSNFPLCSSVRNQGHGKRDKNIYIVLVLAFKGFRQVLLIQGHTKTCTLTPLSTCSTSLGGFSTTVMNNLYL